MGAPTVATINKHLDVLERRTGKLDKALSKNTKINYVDGIKIAGKAVKLTANLKKSAKDVKSVEAVTDADATQILGRAHQIVTLAQGALTAGVTAKDQFEKLKLAGLAKILLKRLQESCGQFTEALVDRAPNDAAKAEGAGMKSDLDATFEKALATYSNATGGEEKEAELEAAEDSDAD